MAAAKTGLYRLLPSLQGKLLDAQEEPHVELYQRLPDGRWQLTEAGGLESAIDIPFLDLALPLPEIYDRVEFGVEENLSAPASQA